MNERDVAAILRGVTPVLREHFDLVARRIVKDAEQAEALRSAEHRAFMAEQREALAVMTRQIADRLAAVKDGRDGIDGINGQDGAPGRDGADGRDGIDGKDGVPGADGRDGVDGAAGAPGQDGAAGKDGCDGVDGQPGRDGVDGRDGTDGVAGSNGLNGRDGNDGAAGVDGKDGRDGAPGADGRDGIDGKDGRDGADAYHGEARGLFDPEATYRALDMVSLNGSEWRAKSDDPGALPGPGWMLSASRGKRGERGDRGERGLPGAAGAAVVASYIDHDNLEHVITLEDGTEVRASLHKLTQIIQGAAR